MHAGYKQLTEFLRGLGTEKVSHTEKNYLAHVIGVYNDMAAAGYSEELCRAGMFHSIYGTELFQRFSLPLTRRPEVRALIGERAERLAYLNCAMDRSSFDQALMRDTGPYVIRDRISGEQVEISEEDFTDLCKVHLYDWLEQVTRSQKWEYRREAYRRMANLLGGVAQEAYNRVFAVEPPAAVYRHPGRALVMSMFEQLDETVWRPVVLAFLRDIKANPDDSTPHLVLADWLEEHGDAVRAARGEFLRLQSLGTPSLVPEREAELLMRFETAWLGPLRPLALSWSWRRGLLHLEIPARSLLDESAELVRTEAFAWVEGVTFRNLTTEAVKRLADSSWLGWLNTLDLGYNFIGDAGVAALAASPNLMNLRTLWLRRNAIGDRGAAALARSEHMAKLETLSLVDNQIGDAGACALTASLLLDHLRLLNMEGNDIGGPGFHALKKAARLRPRLWLHLGLHRRY
jgi:uncharacterized protein (TIGR02996 family)